MANDGWVLQALLNSSQWQSLADRVETIGRRLNRTINALQDASDAFQAVAARRSRLGSILLAAPLAVGDAATITVGWSSPMPNGNYEIDITIPALGGNPVSSIAVQGKNKNGCIVQFTAPSALDVGAQIIVLAASANN